jgi:2-hydroxy-6-oxonona-2,4-dienedioate hydrolase
VSDQPYPEFRWLERGDGAPVVLLHSLMGSMHDWDPVLDILADGSRAIAPALPIFDPALTRVSVEGVAGWVLRFLDALGLEQVALAGNSLGGHVALVAALAAPERVSALILTGSSGLFERRFTRRVQGSITRGVPRRPSAGFIRGKMEEIFFDPALVTPEAVEAVRRSVLDPAIALRLIRMARAAKRDNLEPRLGAITAPSLLIWGREDRITPIDVAERFHARMPGSTLVELRHCGHAPMIEQPEAFGAITRAWLEESRLTGVLR